MPSALPPATGLDTPRNDLSQERAVDRHRYELVDDNTIRVFFPPVRRAVLELARGRKKPMKPLKSRLLKEGSMAHRMCARSSQGKHQFWWRPRNRSGDREVIPLADPELN